MDRRCCRKIITPYPRLALWVKKLRHLEHEEPEGPQGAAVPALSMPGKRRQTPSPTPAEWRAAPRGTVGSGEQGNGGGQRRRVARALETEQLCAAWWSGRPRHDHSSDQGRGDCNFNKQKASSGPPWRRNEGDREARRAHHSERGRCEEQDSESLIGGELRWCNRKVGTKSHTWTIAAAEVLLFGFSHLSSFFFIYAYFLGT